MGGPARLEEPDAGQCLGQHAFEMRQLHDTPRLVPHRRYIAHFRTPDQTLILRVVAGNGMQHIHIFN